MIIIALIVIGFLWALMVVYRLGHAIGWDDATRVDSTYIKVPKKPSYDASRRDK